MERKGGREFGSQCLPNLRIRLVELAVAAQLPFLHAAHPGRQPRQQSLAVGGAILATLLIFDDVAADEPVPQGQAEIDRTTGLRRQLLMHRMDGADEVFKSYMGGF